MIVIKNIIIVTIINLIHYYCHHYIFMDGNFGSDLFYSAIPFNFGFVMNQKAEEVFVDEARPYSDRNLLY